MMPNKKTSSGFTLIEIMIVVAIIGILAAFAYPAYMDTVRKSNRADAKAALSDVSQRLQRCFTAYSAYNDANCAVATEVAGAGITSQEGFYTITGVVAAGTYTLTATPVSGTTQAGDSGKCSTFTLTQAGAKGATGTEAAHCW